MKHIKIFLSILVFIILLIFVFMFKTNEGFQDNSDDGQIFNLRRFLNSDSNTDCNAKELSIPPLISNSSNNSNNDTPSINSNYVNSIRYIMDSNFVYLPNIIGFALKYQRFYGELHSKAFLGGEKMINLDLMGCGISNPQQGIKVFGSDLFLNNLGKEKSANDYPENNNIHRLALNLNERPNTTPGQTTQSTHNQIDLNSKIVIVYPETIVRLSGLYNSLQIPDSSGGSTRSLTLDDLNNNSLVDRNIYEFIYETPLDTDNFKTLFLRVMGVDETLITANRFKIGKTSGVNNDSDGGAGLPPIYYSDLILNTGNNTGHYDEDSGFEEYSNDTIQENFRFVYYKDVMFSTDVAFWRTNVYNEMVDTLAEGGGTTPTAPPDFIGKFSLFSNFDNKQLTLIDALKRKADCKRQIYLLSNMNKYGKMSEEVVLLHNKEQLQELISRYDALINEFRNENEIETRASQGELINLNDIVERIQGADNICNTVENDEFICDEKMTKIGPNGNFIYPDGAQTQDYLDNSMYPTYPNVSSRACPTTTASEGFQGAPDTECPCTLYRLTYSFEGRTENVNILVDGNINVDQYISMYESSEVDRFYLLALNISLFNPHTTVNASEKFIHYAQLFHNIPTQLLRIDALI